MNQNALRGRRTFLFESLERRNPLAGNVTAEVVGGSLFLEGDSSANAVQVRQLSETSWEVRGFGTRINGSNDVFIADDVLLDIDIDLNRGNDFVKVFNGTVGNNLFVETNQGLDTVQLINLNVNGIASITTGDESDSVLVSNVSVDGGEIVPEQQVDGGAFSLATHGGADVVVIDRLFAASAGINLGSGNDSLAMTRSGFESDLRIRAGDGTDAVSLNDVDAEADLWVHLGDGDFDALTIANSSAAAGIFRGGTGDGDTLVTSNNDFDVEIINDFEFEV
jgi:hypothetical protein